MKTTLCHRTEGRGGGGPVTSHVLDTSLGRPAAGLDLTLAVWEERGWTDIVTREAASLLMNS